MAVLPSSKRTNQPGSGFTNLQRVLQANKANKLGSTVAGGIQQAGQAAQGAVNQAGTQFKTQFDTEKQRLASEQDRTNRVLGNVMGASQEDINAFEGIRSGQTKGETSIKNADEIKEKSREAQSLGQAAGNEGGRFGLLQRYVGGNQRYTGGQQRLDNMLLGQTGQGDLRKARLSTSGLVDKAGRTIGAAEQAGQELQNRAKGLSETAIKGLESNVVDYDKAMEAARVKAQNELSARQASQLEQLKNNAIQDEELYKALGLKEDDRLYRTNLADFYQANQNTATKENVQTQADFDKINMLRKLSGNSLTGEASAVLPGYTNADQVDAFKKLKDYTYNQEALKGAIDNERQAFGQTNLEQGAHIQEALRHLYGPNISDEEHERQVKEYGTSARENNLQRQYWSGGGYGDTAIGVNDPNYWKSVLQTHSGNQLAQNRKQAFDFARTLNALKTNSGSNA